MTGADGEISNYYFAIRPNYTFELSDEMAIRAGTSLGLSSRHNHFDSEHVKSPLLNRASNYIFQEEKLCILWDFHTTLQWALWENGGLLVRLPFCLCKLEPEISIARLLTLLSLVGAGGF